MMYPNGEGMVMERGGENATHLSITTLGGKKILEKCRFVG